MLGRGKNGKYFGDFDGGYSIGVVSQAASSEDDEYEARKSVAMEMEQNLQRTKADLQGMLDSVKGVLESFGSLWMDKQVVSFPIAEMLFVACAAMCQSASAFSTNYSTMPGTDMQLGSAIQQLNGAVLTNLVSCSMACSIH